MAVIYASNSDTVALVRALGRSDVIFEFDGGVCKEYLAAEPRAFKANANPLRLIWVGRILPRKALTLALDALTHVRHSFVLTIVGSGLPEQVVRRIIAERGLADRVNWSGRRLTVAEVRAAYLDNDALLFTSVRETAGLQLLEAMALGLPIITLDLHGARDLVPEAAGMKIPVTTPAEVTRNLAAAIDQFASLSAEQKSAMSRAGWEFASTNTWTCRAAQAEALYADLLKTTTGGWLPQSATPAISTAERLDSPL
jgi:glycosyltransferase involved in cell wall biosynthesis